MLSVGQILIAEKAAPVRLTLAFPRLTTFAVHTARIAFALRTVRSGPAVFALALARLSAVAVFSRAPFRADRFRTEFTGPAGQTLAFAGDRRTSVVTERIVARLAQNGTVLAVVVRVAKHTVRVDEFGVVGALVLVGGYWIHFLDAAGRITDDQFLARLVRARVVGVGLMPGLDDNGEHAGPAEVERKTDRVRVARYGV